MAMTSYLFKKKENERVIRGWKLTLSLRDKKTKQMVEQFGRKL